MDKQNNKPVKDFHQQLAQIPSVEEVLQQEELQTTIGRYSRKMVTPLVRIVLNEERKMITHGADPSSFAEVIQRCISFVGQECRSFIRPVINGTGVILHTNLGRATLGSNLMNESVNTLMGFCNLEYDLLQGTRGKRGDFVERMLAVLSHSESALVLNNNAAAVFLILKTLAKEREVVISRGELLQIGGGFRIPDILRESGVILREVGTTNQTNLDDYREAINENTALLLKVHQSNFFQNGFVQSVDVKALKVLGKKHEVPVAVDLGSGTFLPTDSFDLTHEPMVHEMIRSGADMVCFSADKLLGGPQGGIICGKREYLSRIRTDPMYRTFRVGKMTLAVLQSVLLSYLHGNALQDLPVWQMISMPYETIKHRCHSLARRLRQQGIAATCQDGVSVAGGGSLPGKTLKTRLLMIQSESSIEALDQRLRQSNPAVLGRIQEDCLILDPRTIEPLYDKKLVKIISHAFQEKTGTTYTKNSIRKKLH